VGNEDSPQQYSAPWSYDSMGSADYKHFVPPGLVFMGWKLCQKNKNLRTGSTKNTENVRTAN
jgi:hypothetical protein